VIKKKVRHVIRVDAISTLSFHPDPFDLFCSELEPIFMKDLNWIE
jgi:hypothetical protein